ncbi:BlaI/MecI/CopY family transcriptional regulator [Parvularcula dongshanensis]|uniref:Putative transcriptional regulator n=1 Tax=Parvularcula dongshanensis TaxID=1173995 RepID=A0A840I786_9PROT|nr:BlaI/MecI/CopY family transcriptional regulator [Parvularcula dongshanensis]MBB4659968.1 putative transcriptional regulator [Parvularcula dongshanensis]
MRITSAELRVMDVLWETAPLGAAEVVAALKDSEWSDRTVKTLLARLTDKGALAAEPEGRRYLYRPLIAREAHRKDAVSRLSERLFGGRAAPMVAHLADGQGLSETDLDELEALVRTLRGEQDR